MKTIRKHVFETNSSSCHSVTVCGEDKLKGYLANELICIHDFYFPEHGGSFEVVPDKDFYTMEELSKKIDELIADEDFKKDLLFSDYHDECSFLIKHHEPGTLKAIFMEQSDDLPDGINEYCAKDALEYKFFGGKNIYYYQGKSYSESDPFVADEETQKYEPSEIKGQAVTIVAEVSC